MLALASAALFGSMTVALRFALARQPDAEAGALHTIAAALLVTLPFVVAHEIDLSEKALLLQRPDKLLARREVDPTVRAIRPEWRGSEALSACGV